MTVQKIFLTFVFALIALTLPRQPLFAASPDGMGPWADSVVSASQGMMKNNMPVPAIRSDANAAVGIAESTLLDGTFYSLGFGGSLVLKFDNPLANGVVVVESTNPGYPNEKASVQLSNDGVTWVNAGQVTQSGTVSMPSNLSCARYVKISDVSNKDDFTDDTADGYDVDGVRASEGQACPDVTPTPSPTPCDCNCDGQKHVVIKNNGAGSVNTVVVKGASCGCGSKVTQTNDSVVTTAMKVTAKTGGVSIKKNTGGTIKMTTGNAQVNVSVTTIGGSNIHN